jgi:hypothetical protein
VNNFIKQQISRNNNKFNDTNSCIKYFSRTSLLLDFQRQKRKYKVRSQESNKKMSEIIKCIKRNDENSIIISPLKEKKINLKS